MKNTAKRFMSHLMICVLIFSLTGCGETSEDNTVGNTTGSTELSSETNQEETNKNDSEAETQATEQQEENQGAAETSAKSSEPDDAEASTYDTVSVPDPISFFNVADSSIDDLSLEEDSFDYTIITGYDVLDILEAYMELLVSDYGFTQIEYSISYNDICDIDGAMFTDVYAEFSYNNDVEVDDFYIRYAHNAGTNVLWLGYDCSDYEIVDADSYIQSGVTITLPDPDVFLGVSGSWKDDDYWDINHLAVQYTLDTDAIEEADSYIDLLQSDYDLEILSKEYDYESSEIADYYMTTELAPNGDASQGKITIVAASIDDDNDYIYIYLSNLSADTEISWSEDVGTTTVVNSALTVQNPEDYFGATPIQVGSDDEVYYAIFKFKTAEDASRANEEYSELLLEKFTEASTSMDSLRCFCYAGDDGVYGYYKSKAGCTVIADLLYMDEVPNQLQICISKDMIITDLGERPETAYNMVNGSASFTDLLNGISSSDTSSSDTSDSSSDYSDNDDNIAEFAKQDCSICKGSGKCTVCGGDGYLWSSASGKEDRNCWKCNHTGKCTYCNGTGKRD